MFQREENMLENSNPSSREDETKSNVHMYSKKINTNNGFAFFDDNTRMADLEEARREREQQIDVEAELEASA